MHLIQNIDRCIWKKSWKIAEENLGESKFQKVDILCESDDQKWFKNKFEYNHWYEFNYSRNAIEAYGTIGNLSME